MALRGHEMTIRKRNDESGHKRGEGAYSSSKNKLNTITFVAKKQSAGSTIDSNSERKGGFAAKLDKK